MKPAPFDYVRVASVDEAVRALSDAGGEARVLAGGQSLTPLLALRLARPSVLIDINRIPGLAAIEPVPAHPGGSTARLRVGALVRHADLAAQDRHPLLAEIAPWIGHAAIRTRGTSGGSVAHADPSAELPLALAVLDGAAHVRGPGDRRAIAADDLFTGMFETSIDDDEMITALEVAVPERWGFAELARRHGDFGVVTVVVARVDGTWRVAVGGVATVPFRARGAETLLAEPGTDLADPATAARVGSAVADEVDPPTDVHAPAAYRRAMAAELTRRALGQAVDRPDPTGHHEERTAS